MPETRQNVPMRKSIGKTVSMYNKKVLCVCNIQVYFAKCSVDKEVHCHFFVTQKYFSAITRNIALSQMYGRQVDEAEAAMIKNPAKGLSK